MKLLRKSALLTMVLTIMLTGLVYGAEKSVTIIRDDYGVPHVYADTVHGLFYGYGHAIAQDRLFQMEMAKRSTQGRVAEVLGGKFVAFDKKIRQGYSPVSVQKQLDALPPDDRDVFEGYAAGINAWLDKIGKEPDKLLPKEFIDFGFQPESWTAFDVAMIFVGSMANRFGDFNTELDNRRIFQILMEKHGQEKAENIFNQLNPIMMDNAPTTIPKGEWNVTGLARESIPIPDSAGQGPLMAMADHDPGVPHGISGMSNCVIVGGKKVKDARAILMNGPQFGWYIPGYVYSIGLHGAGFDVVGNTPFGYPVILFGHTHDIAWGSTWGAGDMVDIYQETLNPDHPHEYLYKNHYLPMEERAEVIKVKDGEDVIFQVYRTIHGPVISMDEENRVAFAKKRTWDGQEIEGLLGWMYTTQAKNFEEWLGQAERNALNINMYYADKDGNIGYAFTGKYPKRAAGHDNRFPVSGAGDMEWEGLLPFSATPRVLNPAQGFIANWNNKPAEGVKNPDEFWYSWNRADRVDVFINLVESREKLDPDDMWGLIEKAAYADLNLAYLLPFLEQGAEDPKVEQAIRMLKEWDGISRDRDQDGNFDEAATALMRTFLAKVIEVVLADDLGGRLQIFRLHRVPGTGQTLGFGNEYSAGIQDRRGRPGSEFSPPV